MPIFGVNAAGSESGNPEMVAGRTMGLLQDDVASDVWGLWSVAYRDVYVLDPQNRLFAIYNLTSHDLADPANYQSLRDLIAAAAAVPP